MKRLIFAIAVLIMTAASCCNDADNKNTAREAVLDNIANRKSVRAYTDEPVSDADIETLLRAAMAAPSAMNRQPWEFIVLKDRDSLDLLAGKLRHAKMLQQAPLAIVVCAETMLTLRDGTVVENMFWEHDASAATENLLLAAEAIGLGAVWTAASDPERSAIVKDALGIPGTIMPLCVVPIGHPANPDEQPKDKWKPEKIHYNRW
ncbi:MAG: nitroreductase family protein [Bacteroidales bacterium]|nr:nitroreductase family protein [Bacteroidales bacterium]